MSGGREGGSRVRVRRSESATGTRGREGCGRDVAKDEAFAADERNNCKDESEKNVFDLVGILLTLSLVAYLRT